MQAKRLVCLLMFVIAATIQLPAQQNVADGKRVEELRAKAEKGDMAAQSELSRYYIAVKDYTEGVKWARKCAEQGNPWSQLILGFSYEIGTGVPQDFTQAAFWYRKAAELGLDRAQTYLGKMLFIGRGVMTNKAEAAEWFRKAADQGDPEAQARLGGTFLVGEGNEKNIKEGIRLIRKAADQNEKNGQYLLGAAYMDGTGVPQDFVQGYSWLILAAANGETNAASYRDRLRMILTAEQIAQAQKLAREFKPQKASESDKLIPRSGTPDSSPISSGSGFFITEDGYAVTNQHVIGDANQVSLVTSAGIISARIIKVDAANDLALIKAEGRFSALPVVPSRMMRLGSTVATVGFPNVDLQGFAPKLAKGEIASLAGAQDDPRYFQISVPVQPGNSGGALVDELGNVVGVVAAKLSASAALETSGELPENVNYAIKSSFLLGFLESTPQISTKLKVPNTITRKFEDIVKSAEKAAVLVLVYK